MLLTSKQMKSLFLQQSYQDSWEEYTKSIHKQSYENWDYVILTASNEEQAKAYRMEINERRKAGVIPARTEYVVLPDPQGKRVGSGGATLNVLRYIADCNPGRNPFANKRILVIHSGGDSKRIPQYSVSGKLFSPVPRMLPNKRPSTLFDEILIGVASLPGRLSEGMLVMSGDVLILFNQLQADCLTKEAAAISVKASVDVGTEHGVFLNNGDGYVKTFLHKQNESVLRTLGAVDHQDCVDLDTGAVIFGRHVLDALFSLISDKGVVSKARFAEFVNEKARISFYGDFLYPLAKSVTLNDYYKEAAEGTICEELLSCRTKIWEVLHPYGMKLLCLSPAEFIHFGTTDELRNMMTSELEDYKYLGWEDKVDSVQMNTAKVSVYSSIVDADCHIGENCYFENSEIMFGTSVGNNCVISQVSCKACYIPDNTVLSQVLQKDGRFVVRIYGITDNPKSRYGSKDFFLGTTLKEFVEEAGLQKNHIFDSDEDYLWFAKIYPCMTSEDEALKASLIISKICNRTATVYEKEQYQTFEKESLYSSFYNADIIQNRFYLHKLRNRIFIKRVLMNILNDVSCESTISTIISNDMNASVIDEMCQIAEKSDMRSAIRLYYYFASYCYSMKREDMNSIAQMLEAKCYTLITQNVRNAAMALLSDVQDKKILKPEVEVSLPVRVNFGGGWTDTPPFCMEEGGVVLNAAITLRGENPIHVCVRHLKEYKVVFASEDQDAYGETSDIRDIRDCSNPGDFFAIHKAALLACKIVPMEGDADLGVVLEKLGGGIFISTRVEGIPKGSGLGTSSILAAASVKALYEFMGQKIEDHVLYTTVLYMEQLMSTGGGWQDQVGGLHPGFKLTVTEPGIEQNCLTEIVHLSDSMKENLQKRFALIYTGQRRLARNLLRDVVGRYIGAREESVAALRSMKKVAVQMKEALESSNLDQFCVLLNQHWNLSKQLDEGATNTCIEQIFTACSDLIDARFVCGAGGGGFLMVILKENITKEELNDRLTEVFHDTGVGVWDSEFIY